jgi:hypothetical protein
VKPSLLYFEVMPHIIGFDSAEITHFEFFTLLKRRNSKYYYNKKKKKKVKFKFDISQNAPAFYVFVASFK